MCNLTTWFCCFLSLSLRRRVRPTIRQHNVTEFSAQISEQQAMCVHYSSAGGQRHHSHVSSVWSRNSRKLRLWLSRGTARPWLSVVTRSSSADEIGERYRLNHAIVVKLYHPYTQFSRNVCISHQRIAPFLGASWLFWSLWLINTLVLLTNLLTYLLIYCGVSCKHYLSQVGRYRLCRYRYDIDILYRSAVWPWPTHILARKQLFSAVGPDSFPFPPFPFPFSLFALSFPSLPPPPFSFFLSLSLTLKSRYEAYGSAAAKRILVHLTAKITQIKLKFNKCRGLPYTP